jgi:hypothetical protein
MADVYNIARRHFNDVDKLCYDGVDDKLQFIVYIRYSLTYMLLAKRNGKYKQEWTFCMLPLTVISLQSDVH